MGERVEAVMRATAFAIEEMRRSDNRDEWSTELALIWLAKFGPIERAFLLATAIKAVEESTFDQMIFDNGGPPPMEG